MSNVVKFPGPRAPASAVEEPPKKPRTPKSLAGVFEEAEPLTAWQEQLLATRNIEAPENYDDAEFGAAITRESHDALSQLLSKFGISDLDPSDPERFAVALETWHLLTGDVGRLLEFRHVAKTVVYDKLAMACSPLFVQYLDALWTGENVAIRMLSRSLGIHAGVTAEQRQQFLKQHAGSAG